jgi:hypothetical protein
MKLLPKMKSLSKMRSLSNMRSHQSLHNESGNAMFYILIAIALLAALSFAVTQGNRASVNNMQRDRARLMATEVIEHSDAIAKGVQTLRLRGLPLETLSFESNESYSAPNANSCGTACELYHPDGGGLINSPISTDWLSKEKSSQPTTGQVILAGNVCVPFIGKGGANCGTDSIDNEELIVFVSGIRDDVCKQTNLIHHSISLKDNIPEQSSCFIPTYFTGSFTEQGVIDNPLLSAKTAGCFQMAASCTTNGGANIYYQVISSR